MTPYATRKLDIRIGSLQWRIRALKDRDQFSDPKGEAEHIGICSASWSLFGQLWPASQVLAKAVKHIDIANRRFQSQDPDHLPGARASEPVQPPAATTGV